MYISEFSLQIYLCISDTTESICITVLIHHSDPFVCVNSSFRDTLSPLDLASLDQITAEEVEE